MGSCFGKCSCSCCDCFVHNPCSSISFCRKVDTPTLVFRRRTSTIEFENLIFDLDIPVCIALPYSSFYLNIFSYSSFFLGFAYSNLLQFFGCSHQSNLNLDLLCIYFWFYSIFVLRYFLFLHLFHLFLLLLLLLLLLHLFTFSLSSLVAQSNESDIITKKVHFDDSSANFIVLKNCFA